MTAIRDLVLLDGVRTPMAEFNEPFAEVSAIDLGAHAARALFERAGVDPADDRPHGGRQRAADLAATPSTAPATWRSRRGCRKEVPALTVNRLCGSGIQAILSGAHLILAGEAHDSAWSAAWRTCRRRRT